MGRSAKIGGKNIDRARKLVEARPYKLEEAAELLRKAHFVKFDETVELVLNLGVDPKQSDQMVRGTVVLPHGLGKSKRVLVTIYSDRTFTFILKTPPASELLKRAAGIVKGSPEPNRNKVGKLTRKQVEEIAKLKLPDLNTMNLDAAVRSIMGTARNMGIEVSE